MYETLSIAYPLPTGHVYTSLRSSISRSPKTESAAADGNAMPRCAGVLLSIMTANESSAGMLSPGIQSVTSGRGWATVVPIKTHIATAAATLASEWEPPGQSQSTEMHTSETDLGASEIELGRCLPDAKRSRLLWSTVDLVRWLHLADVRRAWHEDVTCGP